MSKGAVMVIHAAQEIHEGVSGGCGDPLPDEVLRELVSSLKRRLAEWTVYDRGREANAYDEAVRGLLRAAVAEGNAEIARRAGS